MVNYLLRRILYAIPILIGINLITFLLFFKLNSPDDIARMHIGGKHTTQELIDNWKQTHGYDKPAFINSEATGLDRVKDTLFVNSSLRLFLLDFPPSDAGRDIRSDIRERMWPSLALAIPTLIIGLLVNISISMLFVFFRTTSLDTVGIIFAVLLMSISAMFYIIFGQYFFSIMLRLVPISGYLSNGNSFKFLVLPVLIGVVSGIGSATRWYRSLFLEEIHKEYVITARAKGLSAVIVLFKHVLKNAMIPISTNIVSLIPLLFLGSLLMESFFGIPGLGNYMILAITQNDFAIVRVMTFLGSVFYIFGLILTDVFYTLLDPRIRLA